MHKPVRPKSAKGKTRAPRSTTQKIAVANEDTSSTQTSVARNASSRSQGRGLITTSYTTPQRTYQSTSRQGSQSHASKPPSTNKHEDHPSSAHLFPGVNRPTSSLSKYRILPSIPGTSTPSGGDALQHGIRSKFEEHGNYNDMELLTEQAQQMILDSATQRYDRTVSPPGGASKRKVIKGNGETDVKRPKIYQTRSVFNQSRKPLVKEPPRPKIPREPGPDEKRLLLALKLPDGSRVERYFNPNTKILNILAFAHSQYPVLPMSQCSIFRMDIIPKKLLDNLDLSLDQLGIRHRTVLYVEEVDDDN